MRRGEGKASDASTGREMEREIERLSEAEQEWRRVGVHSRAASTAAHCGAQPPLCSLLTIRFQALKRPLQQQQSHTAQRGCLLMNSNLTKRLLTRCCALWTADSAQICCFFFFKKRNTTKLATCACQRIVMKRGGSSQFTLPPWIM